MSADVSSTSLATEDPAETIARALVAHPAVARLDVGHYGDVATSLPGRRVVGVRTGAPGAAVEIAVVLWLIEPIPVLVGQLRSLVTRLAGPVAVDIQVVDVLTEADLDAEREAANAAMRADTATTDLAADQG
jgi:hypothetical protein